MASSAVKREDHNMILSSNEDQIFKIPSSTNLPRKKDLLQLPINGLVHPIPKMNIPVVDQQQHRPRNMPTQVFHTYHQLYWDNEWEEHRKNP
uniref:Uncharacterized protein n=1 Tax=Romanomermis culicivorax TaxID=13658 RepID=A0A915HM79_ROMCU